MSTRMRGCKRLQKPGIGIRRVASGAGLEPRFQVGSAIDDSPPELAIKRAVSIKTQLCQCTWRESHQLCGFTGVQGQWIVGHHLSLAANQPDVPAMSSKLEAMTDRNRWPGFE
jgi:hypothetical protein